MNIMRAHTCTYILIHTPNTNELSLTLTRTVTHTHTHNTYITYTNIKNIQLKSKHACADNLLEQCSRETLPHKTHSGVSPGALRAWLACANACASPSGAMAAAQRRLHSLIRVPSRIVRMRASCKVRSSVPGLVPCPVCAGHAGGKYRRGGPRYGAAS